MRKLLQFCRTFWSVVFLTTDHFFINADLPGLVHDAEIRLRFRPIAKNIANLHYRTPMV